MAGVRQRRVTARSTTPRRDGTGLGAAVAAAAAYGLWHRRRRRARATQPGGESRRRAGDIVILCGRDLRCEHVSAASVPLLGYLPETLYGQPLGRIVHPDDLAGLVRYAARPESELDSIPVRLRHRTHGWVWFVATRDVGPGVDFAPRAVADRVRTEQWLATQRLLTETTVTMASDAIVGTDADGAIVEWNRAAERLFGWSREEALGRDAADLILPERLREEYREQTRALWTLGSGRLDEPAEAVMVHRDGRELDVELTGWTVQVGTAWRFNALVRDISARKEVERVLRAAREQADEASRLKSEFLATMSHEIRTPMNGVIGLAEILLGTTLDATQRRYAEGIRTAGAALLSVINDILDFSKAEAGMIVVEETSFDPRGLLEDVIDMVAPTARDKGLELVGYCHPEVPAALLGDPGRLRQVLLNLCGNAVKFTEHGEVIVTASLVETDQPDRVGLRIEVSDTGIGMRPEELGRVFDAFSQADASTTRRYGGTGLGLAIAQRLVNAMDGQLCVTSEPNRGSTFWFEVALRPSPDAVVQPYLRPANVQGLRVLVVDDNVTNRLVLDAQLRQWRLTPTLVASGEEALDALHRAGTHPFDVVVLDAIMPEMDGLELARQISRDGGIPSVHMILLTSGLEVDPAAMREAGVAAWLTKPIHQSQLFDCLARVLTVAEHPQPGSPEMTAPATPRGHVLVAEDNEVNQMVATAILASIGYTTDVAATGAAALDRARERDYDLILMDCQMPELDGYDATAELRRRENGERRTPVIALTAGARAEDRERCLAAGMDDFVPKPIARDLLAAAVARWTAPPSGPDSTPGSDAPAIAEIEDRLRQLGGDDDAGRRLVHRMVESFLDSTPADLDDLAAAVAAGDAASVASQAHRLRGSAGNLGAGRLADDLALLETGGDHEGMDEVIRRLRDEYDWAQAVLRRQLAEYETVLP